MSAPTTSKASRRLLGVVDPVSPSLRSARTLNRFVLRNAVRACSILAGIVFLTPAANSQTTEQVGMQPATASQSGLNSLQGVLPSGMGAPLTITLQDAIERARQNYAQYRAALTAAQIAQEDRVQSRAALLPSLSYTQQYLGTQGNGRTPNGRFVTNDGVHVYRAWGVLHQEVSADSFTLASIKRSIASAALAQAQAEIAKRGLTLTVTNSYYGLINAQHKYASAQQALQQAQHFLELTKELEAARSVAHADVIKAQLQVDQQQIAFLDSQLAMDNAHLALGVLLSPDLNEDFTAVDDANVVPQLPSLSEVRSLVARGNPYIRSAVETLRQSQADVTTARSAFLPSLVVDVDYGIEANAFALRSTSAGDASKGPLPNLGYFVTAALNVPIWNWGATGSKLHQAEYRRKQAQVELSQAQREVLSNLYSYYNEAKVARSQIETLREVSGLASETLRLATLRYRSGEALELEVLEAQNTLTAAQKALDDGEVRYRVALATLQTLTGDF